MQNLASLTISHAQSLAKACQVSVGVFEYAGRSFLPGQGVPFCEGCALHLDGRCDFGNTHLYGCFEAERWGGLYIYYCPATLGFIASTVYAAQRAELALISGPLVIGSLADTLADIPQGMARHIPALPCRSAEDTTALSRVQGDVCGFLSGTSAQREEERAAARSGMHNTLYAIAGGAGRSEGYLYSLQIEKRLQQMILQGDRGGARELINLLLGRLYFSEEGNLARIQENTKGLMVMLSRAAIEGGADAEQIFGQTHEVFSTIDRFTSLDALSVYLTAMFYRFVGYAFDFTRVKSADLVHKVLTYVRANYTHKITLDDVAAHVHLSRAHLSRVLGDELGKPFAEFVNDIRVEKSRELLTGSALPLAEIAMAVGFSDQSYFTKVFRKSVGVSPGEYRRRRGHTTQGEAHD